MVAEGYVVLTLRTRAERQAVAALLGRTTVRERVRVDLAELDRRLRERSGAGGLLAVLTTVTGSAPQDRPARRVAQQTAREEPLALAADLVRAPWADDWVAGLRRTGMLTRRADAEQVVRDAARVLNALPTPGDARQTLSRVELGARLLGDAHALDRDTVLHHVVLRALAAAAAVPVPASARAREELWGSVGATPDLVSRTCLVWGLRLAGDGALARRLETAADVGDPVHITDWDLRRADGFVPELYTRVLVCENPRVLEAIAEYAVAGPAAVNRSVAAWAVVCTAGEPNLVVDQVLGHLTEEGVPLRYHGDFDWPGIALANRAVARHGAQPWRMSAEDYLEGLALGGTMLAGSPVEPTWDAELGAAMRRHARAVHEESVLATLIDDLVGPSSP
nr:TIGR02679 family protein [Ornithinimicrobium sediminis]